MRAPPTHSGQRSRGVIKPAGSGKQAEGGNTKGGRTGCTHALTNHATTLGEPPGAKRGPGTPTRRRTRKERVPFLARLSRSVGMCAFPRQAQQARDVCLFSPGSATTSTCQRSTHTHTKTREVRLKDAPSKVTTRTHCPYRCASQRRTVLLTTLA